jgi:hypothetical protein
MIDKIKLLQLLMPENADIIVRTNGKNEWFVHYFTNRPDGILDNSIYKEYSTDVEKTLDDVIEVINNKGEDINE